MLANRAMRHGKSVPQLLFMCVICQEMHTFRWTLKRAPYSLRCFSDGPGHIDPHRGVSTDCWDVPLIEPSQLTSTDTGDGVTTRKYHWRSDAGKDVGLPVPQQVWMKWLTWISTSGSEDDERPKSVKTPLLVTVKEHKAQTQGFLSYWVSRKITSHLATVNIPQLLWRFMELFSAVELGPKRLHWAKQSSTRCRLFFFFVKLSSCGRKAKRASGQKKKKGLSIECEKVCS